MDTYRLPVQPRETGKKATKAVRNAGLVPCVLYGTHTEPVHFSVETLALRPLIHTTETYRVAISLDGDSHEAIVKEITFHPVTDTPIHVDFQALTRGEALTMTVPVHIEGTAAGVLAGGQISQPLHEIEIRSLPKDIPGHVSLDVTALEMGDSLTVSDLSLPDGVEVLTDGDLTVVSVVAPRVTAEDTADDEAAEAAGTEA
jgi:large subunit ribosomal protein L25